MSTLTQHPMVIRHSEVEANQGAANIIQQAKDEAAAIRARAAQRGFEDGLTKAMSSATDMIARLESAIGAYWSQQEEDLAATALWIAHRIIEDLPADDQLRGVVGTAIAEYRHDRTVVLQADPETARRLGSALAAKPELSGIEIRSDPTLAIGSIGLVHRRGHTHIGVLDQFSALLSATAGQ